MRNPLWFASFMLLAQPFLSFSQSLASCQNLFETDEKVYETSFGIEPVIVRANGDRIEVVDRKGRSLLAPLRPRYNPRGWDGVYFGQYTGGRYFGQHAGIWEYETIPEQPQSRCCKLQQPVS